MFFVSAAAVVVFLVKRAAQSQHCLIMCRLNQRSLQAFYPPYNSRRCAARSVDRYDTTGVSNRVMAQTEISFFTAI